MFEKVKSMSAPELQISQWFNTKTPPTLAGLRGKVVILEAFQMLCPGCVMHGLPLAQRVRSAFSESAVEVIGLHTVFEHHAAMTPVSLEAFLHEYRITFPVGVDAAGDGASPKTMTAFQMRGTPSMLLIDKFGELRAHHFGEVSELLLGAEIATLIKEQTPETEALELAPLVGQTCSTEGCR
ncbi:redoxin domain-containing protein [Pararhizobium sp. IMCC21322]|uniref:redoxin domain-containing protein n=1 Tax=Pararhizobium sp. IMCC21322 TaxID=3067903 RepID=UPI00274255E6|nr:redoxin domain-containing protein [Pararhizobium sp. IMCC21322]